MHQVTGYDVRAERNPDRVELELDTREEGKEGKFVFAFVPPDQAGVVAELLKNAFYEAQPWRDEDERSRS